MVCGIKNDQTLATIVLFCLLVVLTSLAVFLPPNSLGNNTATSEIVWAREIRNSAIHLQECTKRKADYPNCEVEFLKLTSMLESENLAHFDLYKPGFFDVFIKDEILVLRRRSCGKDDLVGRVIGWSAWSQTEKARTESDIKYGQYTRYHQFDVEGLRLKETCLLVVLLPIRDLKRLYIALLNAEKTTQIWMIDQEWSPY